MVITPPDPSEGKPPFQPDDDWRDYMPPADRSRTRPGWWLAPTLIVGLVVLVTMAVLAACTPSVEVSGGIARPMPSGGGSITAFGAAVDQHRHQRVELRPGPHQSAAAMWLAVPSLCMFDGAYVGFHSPIVTAPNGHAPREAFDMLVSYQTDHYRLRSPALADWYLREYGAWPGRQRMTNLTRDELNARFQTNIERCE